MRNKKVGLHSTHRIAYKYTSTFKPRYINVFPTCIDVAMKPEVKERVRLIEIDDLYFYLTCNNLYELFSFSGNSQVDNKPTFAIFFSKSATAK